MGIRLVGVGPVLDAPCLLSQPPFKKFLLQKRKFFKGDWPRDERREETSQTQALKPGMVSKHHHNVVGAIGTDFLEKQKSLPRLAWRRRGWYISEPVERHVGEQGNRSRAFPRKFMSATSSTSPVRISLETIFVEGFFFQRKAERRPVSALLFFPGKEGSRPNSYWTGRTGRRDRFDLFPP